MDTINKSRKITGALVTGAVAGVTLGMLLASINGSKTRRKLIGGAKTIADELKKKMRHEVYALCNKVEELEGLAESKIDSMMNKVKQKSEAMSYN